MFNPLSYKVAWSYGRFSNQRQSEGHSIERQDLQAERDCQEFGWTLAEAYADEGVSGTGAHRKKGNLGRLVEKAATRKNKRDGLVIIVEDIDRLTREQPLEANDLIIQLLKAPVGIWLSSKRQGIDKESINKPGAWHILTAYIDAACAVIESMRNRALLQHDRLWRQKTVTDIHPFWIAVATDEKGGRHYVLNERVKVIEEIFSWCIDGLSYNDIAVKLNRANVPSPSARDTGWHENTIRSYLRERKVLGEVQRSHVDPEHRGGALTREHEWQTIYPPAIRIELWEQAQAAIESRRMKTGGPVGTNFNNILRGISRCHLCHGAMEMRRTGISHYNGNSYLVCRNARRGRCANKSTHNYEVLERFILHHMGDIAYGWEPRESLEAERLAKQIDAVRREIDVWAKEERTIIGQNMGHLKSVQAYLEDLEARKAGGHARINRLEAKLHKERGALDLREAHERVLELLNTMDGLTQQELYEVRKKLHAGLQRLVTTVICKPDRVAEFHLANKMILKFDKGIGNFISRAEQEYEIVEVVFTVEEIKAALDRGEEIVAVVID
jgi:hypothetical protein